MPRPRLDSVAVIVASAFLVVAIWLRWSNPSESAGSTETTIVGTTIDDATRLCPDKPSLTILLLSSPNCMYCRDSLPFYRSMLTTLGGSSTTCFAMAVPFESFLSVQTRVNYSAGLEGLDTLVVFDPAFLGINGLPGILLLNESLRVERYWRGLLPEDGQIDVVNEITRRTQSIVSDTLTRSTVYS